VPEQVASPVRSSRRSWWFALTAIATVGLVARILYTVLLASDLEPGSDATWYALQATIIRSGHGYLDPETFFQTGRAVPTASFPPLWPGLLSAVDLVGPSTQTAFQMVGGVVGTATVVLTGLLGRAIAGAKAGLGAAAVVALSPAMIAADGSLMSDSLAVALIVAAAVLAVRAAERGDGWSFVALGAISGVAVLARSDALVIAVLLIGVATWSARRVAGARPARVVLLSLGVLVLVVAPWTIRSSLELEQPVVLSTNVGSLVEAANCSSTFRGSLLGMWDRTCLHETRRPGRSEAERSEAGIRRGFTQVREEPERVPLVAVTRVLRGFGLWNPLSQAPLMAEETRDEGWQVAAWAYALVTLLVAIPGLVLLARRDVRRMLALVAMIGGTIVVLVLSWGNPRFRLPADPALAVAAAFAIVTMVGSRPQPAQVGT
jgi:4-amino-4-deoxy-L-arabinose transferase-like glycosyltransferase